MHITLGKSAIAQGKGRWQAEVRISCKLKYMDTLLPGGSCENGTTGTWVVKGHEILFTNKHTVRNEAQAEG